MLHSFLTYVDITSL